MDHVFTSVLTPFLTYSLHKTNVKCRPSEASPGGVPETPKQPLKNTCGCDAPKQAWQRCSFIFSQKLVHAPARIRASGPKRGTGFQSVSPTNHKITENRGLKESPGRLEQG